jgi:hypothetical protein
MEVRAIRDPKKILAIRKILRDGKYGQRNDALFMADITPAKNAKTCITAMIKGGNIFLM